MIRVVNLIHDRTEGRDGPIRSKVEMSRPSRKSKRISLSRRLSWSWSKIETGKPESKVEMGQSRLKVETSQHALKV